MRKKTDYMLRRWLVITVAAIVAAGACHGQMLWRVTARSGEVSYIFGTHHLDGPGALSERGMDALDSAATVVCEIDLRETASPRYAAMISEIAAAPADSTLTALLTQAQLDSMGTLLDSLQPGTGSSAVNLFGGMRPRMMSIYITQLLCRGVTGNGEQGVDSFIQSYAAGRGTPVRALETAEEQLRLIYSDSYAAEATELMELVRDPAEARTELERLTALYRTGNLDGIAEMMAEDTGETDDMAQTARRNRAWIPAISEAIDCGSAFIAVGAAHLAGDDGVPALLRREGYVVEPVQ